MANSCVLSAIQQAHALKETEKEGSRVQSGHEPRGSRGAWGREMMAAHTAESCTTSTGDILQPCSRRAPVPGWDKPEHPEHHAKTEKEAGTQRTWRRDGKQPPPVFWNWLL